jgi:hypothetical protein
LFPTVPGVGPSGRFGLFCCSAAGRRRRERGSCSGFVKVVSTRWASFYLIMAGVVALPLPGLGALWSDSLLFLLGSSLVGLVLLFGLLSSSTAPVLCLCTWPCWWCALGSMGMASMAVQVRAVLRVLLRCSEASRVEAEDGGWRVKSMRSTTDVLLSRISCSLPLGVHLSICFGLIGGFKFLDDAWSPRRQSRFPVWRWKTICKDLVVICAFLRVVFAKLGCTVFATVLI